MPPQSILSSVRVKKGQSFTFIMEQCKSISKDHLHCLLLFPSAAGYRGLDWDGAYTQTDRLSRWLTHYWVPINPWLSLQLLVTYTHWPNHRATPKPIWLENSHRWQFVPGMPSEQNTVTVEGAPKHTYSCVLVTPCTAILYAHTVLLKSIMPTSRFLLLLSIFVY